MTKSNENGFQWNIPNILSLYRLAVFPFILFCVIQNLKHPFTVLFIISLVTDILDGYIARKFKLQTKIGARLDSLADIGTVILGILGMFRFQYAAIQPYLWLLLILVLFYVLVIITSLIKFRRISSLHLYSSKVAAYMQGIFFFVLFYFGFNTVVFFFMFCMAIISYAEEFLILLRLKNLQENVKGIYWILKKNNAG